MDASSTRILVAGDLHIGRASSRAPSGPGEMPPERLFAVAGWRALVQAALDQRVQILVLTGDVADECNRAWEALGPLRDGIARLAEAGIETVAVAGNHDWHALPRLADLLSADQPRFRLLGRGEVWERWTYAVGGRAVVHVDGWSFASAECTISPLATYAPPRSDGAVVLGVVHGDLDAAASPYAPLRMTDLRAAPVNAWLLGHIHRPQVHALGEGRFALYPGSVQALDFGETGVHGAWLFELTNEGLSAPRQIALSTVRYEERMVDLGGAEDMAECQRRIDAGLRDVEALARDQGGGVLEGLSLRLRLTGRTSCAGQVAGIAAALRAYTGSGNPFVRIDGVICDVLPELDLAALSRGGSPLAVCARLLAALQSDKHDEELSALRDVARREVLRVRQLREYAALPADAGSDASSAPAPSAVLAEQLIDVLERLRQQEPQA